MRADPFTDRLPSEKPAGLNTRSPIPELDSAMVSFSIFRAPEVERITGFPHHLQRLWRNRGHLDERPRYSPSIYSSLDLAEMCVRYRLSTCSVPPNRSRELGERAGGIVLLAALTHWDKSCEVVGEPGAVDRFIHAYGRDQRVAAALADLKSADNPRFLWSADGRDFRLGDPGQADLLSRSHDTYIFLDLEAMGARIARKAGRPLMMVKLAAPSGGRAVRKFAGRVRQPANA